MKQTRTNANWITRLKQAALILPISLLMAGFQNCGEGFEGTQPEINSQGEMTMKNFGLDDGNAEPAGSTQQGYRLELVTVHHDKGDHIVDQYVAVKGLQGTLAMSRNSFHIKLLERNHPYKVVKDPYKKEVKFAFLIQRNSSPDRLIQLMYDGNYREFPHDPNQLGKLLFDYAVDLRTNTTLNDLQGLKVNRWSKIENLFIGKNRIRNKDITARGNADADAFTCSNNGGDCAQTCSSTERLGWDGTCRDKVISCENNTGTRTWNPRTNTYGACIQNPVTEPDTNDETTASTGDPCVLIPGYDNEQPVMGIYNVDMTCIPAPSPYVH